MRLFVAFDLPEDLRRDLGESLSAVKESFPAARWVREDTTHLTLVFLGEVEPSSIPVLNEALAAAFASHPRFPLHVARPGTFPPRRRARVAWLGLRPTDELLALQRDVREASATLVEGLEARPYHPHVTLARCRDSWPRAVAERWRSALPDLQGRTFPAEQGILYSSTLGAAGARHEPLGAYPLGVTA